ncbi:amidohydrolase family protein [Streptomyces sp. NPDC058486]|uniref:amidohydrolase family protein n=1 Tax=unclassified Streptomyces TaxID=2593676 RepID=UPI00365225F9
MEVVEWGAPVSGVKFWAEGTAWEGSAATSFPYQDNAATRRIGMDPCSHGSMNCTPGQLAELVGMFVERGYPVACHVHGDNTVEAVLDAYERAAEGDPQ